MILQKTEKLTAAYWESQKCVVVSVNYLPSINKINNGIFKEAQHPYTKVVFSNIQSYEDARDLNAVGKFERLVKEGKVTNKAGNYRLVLKDDDYCWEPISLDLSLDEEPNQTEKKEVADRIINALIDIKNILEKLIGGQA